MQVLILPHHMIMIRAYSIASHAIEMELYESQIRFNLRSLSVPIYISIAGEHGGWVLFVIK